MLSHLAANFHLPLSPIDEANAPPLQYLWVQDGCILGTGILWTAAYFLYIKQGMKDGSYGMPVPALCANIGWELIYGVFHPLSYAEMITFIPWFLIDLGIVYTTVTSGVRQFKGSPMIANNLITMIGVGSIFSLVLHWSFIQSFPTVEEAAFWSGFACQNLLGVSSVVQLMSRNHTEGHSWAIWLCRWIGSVSAIAMFSWRHYHYPADYPHVGTAMAKFLFISMEVADVAYALVYKSIERKSKKKTQ